MSLLTQLALPPAKTTETLAAVSGLHVPAVLKHQLSLSTEVFGPAPYSVTVPSSFVPIAIAEVAEVACPICVTYNAQTNWVEPKMVTPIPLSDSAQGWILYPCHEVECSSCYNVTTDTDCGYCEDCGCQCVRCTSCEETADCLCSLCEECSDCCGCYWCSGCEEPAKRVCKVCNKCSSCCGCYRCEYCSKVIDTDYGDYCTESGDIHCSDCCDCSRVTAGWSERGTDTARRLNPERGLQQLGATKFDPVTAMADFYLLDFIGAVLPSGLSRKTDAWRGAAVLKQDAKTLQDDIIRHADELFRLYVLTAIGGEVRHHPAVKREHGSSSRETFWSRFVSMADSEGSPVGMIEDACNLFGDYGAWESGFGGRAWETAAKTLLKRETGELDARTFVDRVFSLQHNSGSLLNKSVWAITNARGYSVDAMTTIGDAHHNSDWQTLVSVASPDVVGLLRELVTSQSWVKGLTADDKRELANLVCVTGGEG